MELMAKPVVSVGRAARVALVVTVAPVVVRRRRVSPARVAMVVWPGTVRPGVRVAPGMSGWR